MQGRYPEGNQREDAIDEKNLQQTQLLMTCIPEKQLRQLVVLRIHKEEELKSRFKMKIKGIFELTIGVRWTKHY